MNDEELQRQLRRLDPSVGMSIDPAAGPRAAALKEQIMHTPSLTPESPSRAAPRGWRKFAVAGAAAALLGGGALAISTVGGGGSASPTKVEYQLGPQGDPLTASCLAITEFQPPAGLAGFKGTVTTVGDSSVTLDVSRWFAGGDADEVVLDIADVASPALDGIEFVVGTEYLVAVADGQVQTCGASGIAEPVLEQLYETWFAA